VATYDTFWEIALDRYADRVREDSFGHHPHQSSEQEQIPDA
jgi:hypothetical protein